MSFAPSRVSARGYFLWCNWLAGNLTQHIDNEAGISYNYEYNEHDQVTEYTEKKGTTTRVRTSGRQRI